MAVFRIIPNQPIPNSPFYTPEADSLVRPSGPVIIGSGLTIDYEAGVINAAGGGGGLVSVLAPITNSGTASAPIIGIDGATTTQSGAVQLNNTTTNPSTTLALTAAMGKYLQDQINALTVSSNIALAGTLNATTAILDTVTASGAAAGFTAGSNLPPATLANTDYFVIVVEDGLYTPPGGVPTVCTKGDWFLSNGTSWEFLDVGPSYPAATTTALGIVELATQAEAEAKTDGTLAVTPASLINYVLCTCFTKGQLLTGTATPGVGCVLPYSGVSGQVLTVSPAAPSGLAWCAPAPSGIPCACLTAKGALISAAVAGVPTALPVGADSLVLTACAACPTGLTWAPSSAPATSGIPCACLNSRGALITADTPTLPIALALGSNGTVLTACAACFGGMYWGPNYAPVPATPVCEGVMYGCTTALNTTLGCCAGYNNSGVCNVIIGSCAALNGLSGTDRNVVIGVCSCIPNNGDENVVIGVDAGSMFSLRGNVFLGASAGDSAGAGDYNVAMGYRSGISAFGGTGCRVALGYCSGVFAQSNSIAIGSNAGFCVGQCSIAIGEFAGTASQPQSSSIFLGHAAGTGSFGTASCSISIGFRAGEGNQSAKTIAIGCLSGLGAGANAIGIGYLTSPQAINSIAIGNGASVSNASSCSVAIGCGASSVFNNEVLLQGAPATYRYFNPSTPTATWLGPSDGRDKTNVQDLALGLNFISDIQPRTFVWDPRDQDVPNKGCRSAGFIAQEVREVLQKHDAEYTGIVSERDPEHLAVAPGGFTPMIINAIKELADEVARLREEVASLKNS